MKKLLSVLVLVLSLFLLSACGGKLPKDSATAKEYLDATVAQYNEASEAQFEMTLTKGEETETIKVAYKFENGEVQLLSAVLTDKNGDTACYVKDGFGYFGRYNGPKNKEEVSSELSESIATNYGFSAWVKRITEIFGSSFFLYSNVESSDGNKLVLNCDLEALDVDYDNEPEDVMQVQDDIEKLKELESAKLEMTFEGKNVTSVKGIFVTKANESKGVASVTSSIELKFLGTAVSDVEIPNQSDYVAK